MFEGQGQIDEMRAKDEQMNWMLNGDSKQMKARRQGVVIYVTPLIHSRKD